MAYGTELVIGWGMNNFKLLEEQAGIIIPDSSNTNWWDNYQENIDTAINNGNVANINDKLKLAHIAAIKKVGFSITENSDMYILADTPLGERSFAQFRLEFFYDPEEGDEPENAILGIGLSSRYYPTFTDWTVPNGAVQPIQFDANTNKLIKIARKCIETELPFVKTATTMVVMRHY